VKKTTASIGVGSLVMMTLLGMPVHGQVDASWRDGQLLIHQGQYPEGVTQEKIAQGETLFTEIGCTACHGANGQGMPGMTSSLTDGEWSYVEGGAYPALIETITNGVSAQRTGGLAMPAKGGKDLTDEQIQALAAYLWSVNQPGE
jgi:mono/diheme cytochrome c family protein